MQAIRKNIEFDDDDIEKLHQEIKLKAQSIERHQNELEKEGDYSHTEANVALMEQCDWTIFVMSNIFGHKTID